MINEKISTNILWCRFNQKNGKLNVKALKAISSQLKHFRSCWQKEKKSFNLNCLVLKVAEEKKNDIY